MAPTLKSGHKALFIKSSPGRTLLGIGDKWLGKIVLIARVNSHGARDFYQVKRITEIKDGKFFVTGDNEAASTDSRDYGWLKPDEIVGKYLFKLNLNRNLN
jgi:hypothetical protein